MATTVTNFDQIRQMPPEFRTDASAPSETRHQVAHMIAQTLLSLHCREEGVRLVRLQDVSRAEAAPFVAVGELAVQLALNPALERTAVMAAANLVVHGTYQDTADPDLAIKDLSHKRQAWFYQLTRRVIDAWRHTLAFQSPDAALDRQYDDLLQVLEIEGLVQHEQ